MIGSNPAVASTFNYASFAQRYKTSLCRHWQTTGSCQIGAKCHFAHGPEELRNPNDPIKDPSVLATVMANPVQMQSFKSIRCKYNDIGACRYGQACYFSHADNYATQSVPSQIQQQQLLLAQQYQQLLAQQQQHLYQQQQPANYQQQQPQQQLQQQQQQKVQEQQSSTVQNQSQQQTISAQSTANTASNPSQLANNAQTQSKHQSQTTTQQSASSSNNSSAPTGCELTNEQKRSITISQLQHMLFEMSKLPLTPEYSSKITLAKDSLNSNNIQTCSKLLNEIINRQDCPLGEKLLYEAIINDAQKLAINLMQQYQMEALEEQQEQAKCLIQQKSK